MDFLRALFHENSKPTAIQLCMAVLKRDIESVKIMCKEYGLRLRPVNCMELIGEAENQGITQIRHYNIKDLSSCFDEKNDFTTAIHIAILVDDYDIFAELDRMHDEEREHCWLNPFASHKAIVAACKTKSLNVICGIIDNACSGHHMVPTDLIEVAVRGCCCDELILRTQKSVMYHTDPKFRCPLLDISFESDGFAIETIKAIARARLSRESIDCIVNYTAVDLGLLSFYAALYHNDAQLDLLFDVAAGCQDGLSTDGSKGEPLERVKMNTPLWIYEKLLGCNRKTKQNRIVSKEYRQRIIKHYANMMRRSYNHNVGPRIQLLTAFLRVADVDDKADLEFILANIDGKQFHPVNNPVSGCNYSLGQGCNYSWGHGCNYSWDRDLISGNIHKYLLETDVFREHYELFRSYITHSVDGTVVHITDNGLVLQFTMSCVLFEDIKEISDRLRKEMRNQYHLEKFNTDRNVDVIRDRIVSIRFLLGFYGSDVVDNRRLVNNYNCDAASIITFATYHSILPKSLRTAINTMIMIRSCCDSVLNRVPNELFLCIMASFASGRNEHD